MRTSLVECGVRVSRVAMMIKRTENKVRLEERGDQTPSVDGCRLILVVGLSLLVEVSHGI